MMNMDENEISEYLELIDELQKEKVGNPKNVGPQIGEGNLVGGLITPDSILIELNPQYSDNNLQLSGSYSNNLIKGKWMWISFIGLTNEGTFEAVREESYD